MSLYERFVLAPLIDRSCSQGPVMALRQLVVPMARGTVLEIGVGSGLNLPFYDDTRIEKIWALEPSPWMRARAEGIARTLDMEVEFIDLPGEEIPLDDNSVDTVLMTFTLCTIPGTERALRAMARVLKPGGSLMFCEHGESPDESVHRWQNRLTPIWKRIGGGCHMNRPIAVLIEQGGFRITRLETEYMPGWRPASFIFLGEAVPVLKEVS